MELIEPKKTMFLALPLPRLPQYLPCIRGIRTTHSFPVFEYGEVIPASEIRFVEALRHTPGVLAPERDHEPRL